MRDVTVKTDPSAKFTQTVEAGPLRFLSDEPLADGGGDLGPSPFDMLLAALGSCTSMTVKMVAERRGWPLEAVEVRLSATRGEAFAIRRDVTLTGPLSDEQRQSLLAIANKCPVHKALSGPITIETALV
ncbi:MAG: OsmC family protein [Polyangiaceae bacterium]|nr:OsmC family protein [Polyangiaceae bacterium]